MPRWAMAVFLFAFALRLGLRLLSDAPLVFLHQYQYFAGGLAIVEHPWPWDYVLRSEEWHTWGRIWTMAPLYHLFVALVFTVLGPHLLPLQVVQCLLGAATAVAVGALGRRIAGPRGAWSGLAYALYWPAVELPAWTLTENLHTVLLVTGLALLARSVGEDDGRPGVAPAIWGGFLLGLSALARAVSLAFLPMAAFWRWRAAPAAAARPALLLLLAGVVAVAPWTARNLIFIGDAVPIETVSFFNLWTDNAFVDAEKYDRQALAIAKKRTGPERRAQAARFAWAGIRQEPRQLAGKVVSNFAHFFRPEGLHRLLRAETPHAAWGYVVSLLFDDLMLALGVPLFLVYLMAGRASPTRALLGLWAAYYLLMVVVLFHNETRYRSAFAPLALAGAAGGVMVLADAVERRRTATRLAVALGLGLVAGTVGPYVGSGWRAGWSTWTLLPAQAAISRGDLSEASGLAFAAASVDSVAARPWLIYGRWLVEAGRTEEAVEALERAARRSPDHWVPRLVLPRLWRDLGRLPEAEAGFREANGLSWDGDPWLALEVAWRELPAPRGNDILLSRGDYGAVRGFLHPRAGFRWTRHRAFLRLLPAGDAQTYDVTLDMGSPAPSPLASPTVTVRAVGQEPVRFTLTREIRPYTWRISRRAGEPVLIELDTPTWNRSSEPAEQGVAVARMAVAPAR